MLEQRDLEILQKMMENVIDTRVAESEMKVENMIDSRIAASETKVENIIDSRIAASENIILEEIDRTQTNLENKINTLKENLEELKQYYRITKLENDTTTILLKMIEDLSKRVEQLEKKSA